MQYRNSEILLKKCSPHLRFSPEWIGTTLALRASLAKPSTLQDPEIGSNAPGFASCARKAMKFKTFWNPPPPCHPKWHEHQAWSFSWFFNSQKTLKHPYLPIISLFYVYIFEITLCTSKVQIIIFNDSSYT